MKLTLFSSKAKTTAEAKEAERPGNSSSRKKLHLSRRHSHNSWHSLARLMRLWLQPPVAGKGPALFPARARDAGQSLFFVFVLFFLFGQCDAGIVRPAASSSVMGSRCGCATRKKRTEPAEMLLKLLKGARRAFCKLLKIIYIKTQHKDSAMKLCKQFKVAPWRCAQRDRDREMCGQRCWARIDFAAAAAR